MPRRRIDNVFSDLLLTGVRGGRIPAQTQEAKDWYRKQARKVKADPADIMRDSKGRLKNTPKIGEMFFFYYDPKHKKTLPYYDRFPLIFPIKRYKDGFLGINLHYLPYKERALLMDALYSVANNKKFDENTKLKISYDILKSATKFKYFKPCIKRYLSKHLRSRVLKVFSSEWDIALFLPVHQFEKANARAVWKDSRKIWKKK